MGLHRVGHSWAHAHTFFNWVVFVCLFVVESSELFAYLGRQTFSRLYCLQLFFQSVGCLCIMLMGFLCCAKPRSLNRSHLFIFAFISVALGDWPKKTLLRFMLESVLPMFSSRSFMVLCLMFKSLSHFKFIFLCGMKVCSNLTDLEQLVLIFPMPIREGTFFPLHIFASFVKD